MNESSEILNEFYGVGAQVDLSNPFPGLRPFNVDESHLFFGREGQSDEVLQKLSENKFAAIIGASGSGKSSFMYCGVIPILYGGFMAEANSNWNVVVTRPGSSPIDNLAEALLQSNIDYTVAEGEEKIIRRNITSTLLRSFSLGLTEAVKQLHLADNQNVLILVDQFEELFRFKRSEEGVNTVNESLAFVNLLMQAIRSTEVPIYVAITMRSDYIGDCAQFPELTERINDSQYLIPQMVREQKRLAIEGPIAVSGANVSPRLVQQILNDLGDNPDQLPIMQHALMRTWSYWSTNHSEGESIDIRHYEAIGKMTGALSQHADEAYDELPEQQKFICETMFKALTEKDNDGQGVRRPTKISTVASIAGVTNEEVMEVVNHFRGEGRSLLMPPITINLTSETTVDISHESLMRIWTRLKKWVEEEYESVQMYLRLSEASSMYQVGKAGLWRPPDLQLALNWETKNKPSLDWAQRYDQAYERAMVFLGTSKETFDTEQRIKEMLQKRALKRARIIALVLGTAAVISIGFLVFSIFQTLEAQRQEARANEQTTIAIAEKEKAEKAKLEAQRQEQIAIKEKAEAERQKLIAEKEKAEALRQKKIADEQTLLARISQSKAEKNEKIAQEKEREANIQRALAIDNADKAYRLRLLSIAQSMAVKSLQQEDTMLQAVMAQQAYSFHVNNGGKKYNHDVYDGLYYALKKLKPSEYNSMKGHTNAVRSIVYGSDGKTLYTTGSDGQIIRWNTENVNAGGEVVFTNSRVNRMLAISNNGSKLAVASESPAIQILDVSNPASTEAVMLRGHKGVVYDIVFTADNNLLSIAGDSSLFLWNVNTSSYKEILKGTSKFKSLAISPDGQYAIVGNDQGQVIQVNISNPSDKLTIFDTKGRPVQAVAYSNDGSIIAFGDDRGVVRLCNAANGKLVMTLSGQKSRINDIKFSKDDRYMASASFDASVRLYDLNDLNEQPLVLKDHDNWVWSLTFSPDGTKLIAGCVDNLIRVWPTSIDYMSAEMCDLMQRNMSADEWNRFVATDIPYEKTCTKLPKGEGVKED